MKTTKARRKRLCWNYAGLWQNPGTMASLSSLLRGLLHHALTWHLLMPSLMLLIPPYSVLSRARVNIGAAASAWALVVGVAPTIGELGALDDTTATWLCTRVAEKNSQIAGIFYCSSPQDTLCGSQGPLSLPAITHY